MKHLIENLAIALLAIFAPIQAALLTVVALIFIDLITGMIAARKRGEQISSSGIKRTIGKIFLYEIAIMAAFLCQQYLTGEIFPVSKIVAGLIGVVELKSILENLGGVGEGSVFKAILGKVVQEEQKQEPPK